MRNKHDYSNRSFNIHSTMNLGFLHVSEKQEELAARTRTIFSCGVESVLRAAPPVKFNNFNRSSSGRRGRLAGVYYE